MFPPKLGVSARRTVEVIKGVTESDLKIPGSVGAVWTCLQLGCRTSPCALERQMSAQTQ